MTIHLCHEGRQLGDFSKEQVEAMLKAGVITDSTLAWSSGLANWKALREVLGAATPPPVPSPQTVAATVLGQPPGHSKPTDDTPKTINVPTVIAQSPQSTNSRNSEVVKQELLRLSSDTRLGKWCILAWIGVMVFIPVVIANSSDLSQSVTSGNSVGHLDKGGIQLDPDVVKGIAELPALLCLVAALRGVARKATATVLAKRNWQFRRFGREVYLPAIWGTLWRSAIPVFLIACLSAFGSENVQKGATSFVGVIFIWLFFFLFVLDRPLWYKARIRYLAAISQGDDVRSL